jgi:hypothetical protein
MYVPTSPTERFILECSQNTVFDSWFQAAMQRSALVFCVKKLESLTHFIWVWNLALHIMRRIQDESVKKFGA